MTGRGGALHCIGLLGQAEQGLSAVAAELGVMLDYLRQFNGPQHSR